jgi:hypothetical protein
MRLSYVELLACRRYYLDYLGSHLAHREVSLLVVVLGSKIRTLVEQSLATR